MRRSIASAFRASARRLSPQLLRTNVERRRERYAGLASRLRAGVAANSQVHRTRIARERERVTSLPSAPRRAVRHLIAVRQARAERGAQLLAAFSYRGVLARGFALVRDAAAQPLRSAAAVSAGMPIEIEFSDGRVGAHADGRPECASQRHDTVTSGEPVKRGRREAVPDRAICFEVIARSAGGCARTSSRNWLRFG